MAPPLEARIVVAPHADREPFGGLTEEEIEQLVSRVSQKVVESFYAEVGKNVVKKGLWLAGMVGVGLAIFFGFAGNTHK